MSIQKLNQAKENDNVVITSLREDVDGSNPVGFPSALILF